MKIESWWLFNYLPKEGRYLGYHNLYYDAPIHTFGFWFFNCGYWGFALEKYIDKIKTCLK